jgi:hypothetical protein
MIPNSRNFSKKPRTPPGKLKASGFESRVVLVGLRGAEASLNGREGEVGMNELPPQRATAGAGAAAEDDSQKRVFVRLDDGVLVDVAWSDTMQIVRVIIKGLRSATHLNGKEGLLLEEVGREGECVLCVYHRGRPPFESTW